MEGIIFLGIIVGVCILAYILGIRDRIKAEKLLIQALKKNYGQAPKRKYKEDDLDHLQGYYLNHKKDYQVDDITWNDLNMDGVFARMNYCLSASGEEYLYYMLRTPQLSEEFEEQEKQVEFFRRDDEARRHLQVIFSNIGRKIRYSIYDYIEVLDKVRDFSNTKHYIMIGLLILSVAFCFVNTAIGFAAFIVLSLINIVSYFSTKGEIDPYLSTYGYILRVIDSVDNFEKTKYPELSKDIEELTKAAAELKGFTRGSYVLMSPYRMNSGGNPAELLMDYIRMSTHIDIIKFNQMYKQIMQHKEALDTILTITGKLEAEISIACFRESVKDSFAIPSFVDDKAYKATELYHPLIENCVKNDVDTSKGMLITGSNASGKSTYLKTCAVNAILAQTIHTVLGKSYTAPFFKIYSSMALKDDLFEGDSYYIVEIKSIKRILDAAANSKEKVLCFVDEVLRGTNTVERIAASTEILRTFTTNNVLCFAATHDIELTALLKDEFDICHFEGLVENNDVRFDYLLKEGPATNRNAISLLGVLGYNKDIVDNARKLSDRFLTTGKWE